MANFVKDKVIIVTGGSSGFGLATAEMLIELGAKVVITGRNKEKLTLAASEINSENLLAVQADATVTVDWKRLIEVVKEQFGRIDVLVNNHGGGVKIDSVENMDDESIQGVLDINLTSTIKGCREVVKEMKTAGVGHVVNVASVCAKKSWPQWSVYTAAKAGLLGFTKCLHLEMAEWGGKATTFIPAAAKTNFCQAAGLDVEWMTGYPTAEDFAGSLVNCINVPENCVIEEMTIWGTAQSKDIIPL